MTLTPKQSLVLRLYYRDGLKQREIAERFGVGQSAIAMQIARARVRLSRCGIDLDRMTTESLQDLVVLTGLMDG